MLRFCEKETVSRQDYESALTREPLRFDNHIWEDGRERFKYLRHDAADSFLIPVADEHGEIICLAYQDNEANRELRMLKELRKSESAQQFMDVFSQYKEVIICGCNELAVSFAEYLKGLGIAVSVTGEYWDHVGYQSDWKLELTRKRNRLVLYAEGLAFLDFDSDKRGKRSVSPEFECIDKLYEANVLAGKICDTAGNADGLFLRLKGNREIVILGADARAQDAYDLLMARGIDIFGFAVDGEMHGKLLGRELLNLTDAMEKLSNPVFLNCNDRYGALGEEWTEYFDYRGYERNENYFLLRDYITDIPTSNLVHVLRGKRVQLTGDRALCRLLSEYLNRIENGEVDVQSFELGQKVPSELESIRFLVIPDYKNRENGLAEIRARQRDETLSNMGFTDYSVYFVRNGPFALVDLYLNSGHEKYSLPELTPKGVLLGRIPGASGNVFFRGVMDGHPEILEIPYSDLNENLFWYCVRLANVDSSKVLNLFWEMYDEEAYAKEKTFPNLKLFETAAQRLLRYKRSFTSQELFVIFQLAYAEMMGVQKTQNINGRSIYWEPHYVNRNDFPFFAWWLEDEKINGQTIVLRRDNIVRTGSACKRKTEGAMSDAYKTMILNDSFCDEVHVSYRYWSEFKMRFEDIKLQPREKLGEVCEKLGIAWSDNMLQTTTGSRPLAYRGSVDFDLKAVFNQYEDFLAEFDRFRISIASSLYQKRFGYSYENCLKFSRRELQELFLKPFLFDEKRIFEDAGINHMNHSEWFEWRLWEIRKRMILDDICPEFESVELKQTGRARMEQYFHEHFSETVKESVEFAERHEKLIAYGTGCDCKGLLRLMDDRTRKRIVYCDKQAAQEPYTFEGKEVIPPRELCGRYKDYSILVTSSQYAGEIQREFCNLGVEPSRVYYNKAEFGIL